MSLVVPDACTLPTAERPVRLAEFDELFVTAVRAVERVSVTHARMRLTGPAGLAVAVRELTARETECCSFFTFTVTVEAAVDGEALTLDVEVPVRHADVLAALADRAATVSAGRTPTDPLVDLAELATRAEGLGIGGGDLTALVAAWRREDCSAAQHRLRDAVTARLAAVQAELAEQLRLATEYGPGSAGWAEASRATVSLAEDIARLQAVAAALHTTAPAGPCGDDCGCAAALAAPGTAYHFPTVDRGRELACDLVADGGQARDRISVWQQVFTRVQRRDPLPDTDTGVVLRFPLESDLAATLARLAAAEYRCCSFGSYTIVIDHTGLRLEVRMPAEAAGMLDAVLGRPDPRP